MSGPDHKGETELRHRADTCLLLLPAAHVSKADLQQLSIASAFKLSMFLRGEVTEDDLQHYCLCRLLQVVEDK